MKKTNVQDEINLFQQQSNNNVSGDLAKVMEELHKRFEDLNLTVDEQQKTIFQLQTQIKDAVSSEILSSIAQDINITLSTISSIDRTAQEIVDKEDEIGDTLMHLENNNRIYQATELRDMIRMKYKAFFKEIITLHKVLRNDLEKLQSKIRDT